MFVVTGLVSPSEIMIVLILYNSDIHRLQDKTEKWYYHG